MGILSWLRRGDDGVFRKLRLRDGLRLYVSPMPFGAYDPGNRVLNLYREHGIRHVVMLVREAELHKKARRDIRNLYLKHDIAFTQFELVDLTAPTLEALDEVVRFTADLVRKGTKTAIHCHAGTGRTAVVACCTAMLVNDLDPEAGMALVLENMEVHLVDEQVRLIRRWYDECLSLPPVPSPSARTVQADPPS